MNKRMNLYASLIAIALASGVTTSCSIDDTYDLDKEFDMTVGLGSEGLSLRLGNTEHVMLNDVLDIEDNDLVETDGQNLYYLVKTDHTSFDVSVKNAIGSIEHVEINSSQDVVSFDDFDNPDGASSVVVAAGREFSKAGVDGSSPIETNIDDISDDINSLRAIYPKSSVFDLKLEVSPSNPNLDFMIESVRNMEIQFPDYVKILNTDANNVLHIADLSGVGSKSVVLGQVYLDHLDFGEGPNGLGLPIETDEQGNHYIRFTDDITMRGDFAVTSAREQYMNDGDVVKMRLFVELQGGGQIEAERVQGEVNPEINPEIDPVEISNDLPDFLTDNRVTLNMQNPTIRFDIDATNLPVPVEFSGSVTSVADGGQVIGAASLPQSGKNDIPFGHISTYYYSQTDQPYDPDGIAAGSYVEVVNDLNSLIRKLPDHIQVDCKDGRVNVKQGVLHDIYLDRSYSADVNYEVLVPFTFNAGTTIVYNDSVDDMNDDLKDYQVKGFDITADAYNLVPMELEISVEPVGVDGRVLDGVDVTTDIIAAGDGTTATKTPITLTLTAQNPADISRLDKLRFHIVAVSPATGELRSDQYFYLDNLRLKLLGQVIGDFN